MARQQGWQVIVDINTPAIAKKLAGKGGALITRQYLRDAKSINPIKRIKAIRALSKEGK